jgi:hypothetical protein
MKVMLLCVLLFLTSSLAEVSQILRDGEVIYEFEAVAYAFGSSTDFDITAELVIQQDACLPVSNISLTTGKIVLGLNNANERSQQSFNLVYPPRRKEN